MRRLQQCAKAIVGVAFAAMAICSTPACAGASRTKQEELDIAALNGATWLKCGHLPVAAGSAQSVTWNYRETKFETSAVDLPGEKPGPNDKPEDANLKDGVLIFDNTKERALLLDVETGDQLQKLSDVHADSVGTVISSLPIGILFNVWGYPYVLSISHFRATDGRFVGLFQGIGEARLFSGVPTGLMIPIGCAMKADDALIREIEAVRVEWLSQSTGPRKDDAN